MNAKVFVKKGLPVFFIIVISVLIRIYNINGSLFDFNPLRQALNAFVARNFAFLPQANFFLPQADNLGTSPGYLMFELPILPFMAAQLIKIFGLHNWVFRLPSILFFMLSAVYFYKLCLKLSDYRTSIVALIFYCLAPMSILMSRVFQVESLMIFCLISSIYYFFNWLERESFWCLFACTLGLTLFLLAKFPNIYIFLFIYSLFFINGKKRLIYKFIIPTFIVIGVNVLWWVIYSSPVRSMYPNEYTVTQGVNVFSISHIANIMNQYALSLNYWLMTAKQCFWQVFSPAIFILLIFGIISKKLDQTKAALICWVISVLIFFAVIPSAALQDYYKLHLIPAGVLLASFGYFVLMDRIKQPVIKKLVVSSTWIIIFVTIFSSIYPIIRYKSIFAKQEVVGARVQKYAGEKDLVIASFGPDAGLLFYCNRKGWNRYLLDDDDNIRFIEERRKEGASFFVSGNLDELDYSKTFKDYLFKHYLLLEKGDREFDLPQKYSLDYLLWKLFGKRKEFERKSLGYVIFDLRKER